MIIIRVLFCLVSIFVASVCSIFVGIIVAGKNDNQHRSVTKTIAWLLNTILLGVFATLYFVKIGLI